MPNTHAVASQAQTVLPTPEVYWKYWEGQRKINGLLFTADMNLVTAILELKKMVDKVLEHQGVAQDPQLTVNLDKAISEAKKLAESVPAVDPPGCTPPPW